MRKYETIFILQPDLAEDDVKVLNEKLLDVIATGKGDLKRLEDWGSRKLAYLVKKFNRGRYFYLRFDGNAAVIAELERRLRLDDRILRYQSVKLEKEAEAPAPVAEKKPAVAEPAEAAEAAEAAE